MEDDKLEKVKKLPKWAQDHIRTLQMRLREAEQAAAEMSGSVPNAVVWADPYRANPRPLEVMGRPVRFTTDEPDETRSYIDVSMVEPGVVRVHGARALSIHPEVSNGFTVRLVER